MVRTAHTKIALVVNEGHALHQVHDRGYVESPARIAAILRGISQTGLFTRLEPRRFSERTVKEVHDSRFVNYLKRMCAAVEPGRSIYPYIIPIRNANRPPRDLSLRAGYYAIDTFTPLNQSACYASRGAVDCALTAARSLLQGYRLAYALVRPPGHHAERSGASATSTPPPSPLII